MTAHAPKTLALEAYRDGLLSPEGEARLLRHLEGCAVCREQLACMADYASVVEEARALPPPEVDWDAMEARLDVALPTSSPARPKWRRAVWPAIALAAAGLLAYLSPRTTPAPAPRAERQPTVTTPAPAPVDPGFVEGWVTLAGGAPEHRPQAPQATDQQAEPGSAIREGHLLRTGRDEVLHARLSTETGMVLRANSELKVDTLREQRVALTVNRGEVTARVRELDASERFEVRAGPYLVRVRGTRFTVRYATAAFAVAVHEGAVEVLRHGKRVAELGPGEAWSDPPQADMELGDRVPHGLTALSEEWPSLRLPDLPQVTDWRIEDASLGVAGAVALRHAPGPAHLQLVDRQGRLVPVQIEVSPEGAELTEEDVLQVLREARRARMGYLAPEQIAPVVKSGLGPLQRCYEHSLRRDPSIEGRFRLEMYVAPTGVVRRAQVSRDSDLPQALQNCIEGQARRWTFPAPEGGPVAFEVPLNLKSRRQ